ncbi:hypothetical protein B0H34DRAFT_266552 [Crassisporium funariophilum]|nr:hypothetical protein B0H34DRAFT_266552 [Crassisporium funariophilum]
MRVLTSISVGWICSRRRGENCGLWGTFVLDNVAVTIQVKFKCDREMLQNLLPRIITYVMMISTVTVTVLCVVRR